MQPQACECGRGSNSAVACAYVARLHPLAIDSRGPARFEPVFARLLLPVKVDVFHVKGVDVAGDVPEQRQADVDEEVWGCQMVCMCR